MNIHSIQLMDMHKTSDKYRKHRIASKRKINRREKKKTIIKFDFFSFSSFDLTQKRWTSFGVIELGGNEKKWREEKKKHCNRRQFWSNDCIDHKNEKFVLIFIRKWNFSKTKFWLISIYLFSELLFTLKKCLAFHKNLYILATDKDKYTHTHTHTSWSHSTQNPVYLSFGWIGCAFAAISFGIANAQLLTNWPPNCQCRCWRTAKENQRSKGKKTEIYQ